MRRTDDANFSNEEFTALNNFLGSEEQSFEQFSNMFNLISVGESPSVNSESMTHENNIDGILSYLETRENDVISGQHQAHDIGTFTVVSQSIPQSETIQRLDTFSNGGLQCLDVMLNHLQARETSLERSPEYSVELNMRDSFQIESNQLQPAMDNRFVTDSSENCSSEVPDNDRRAVIINNSESSLVGTNISDGIEIIELVASEQLGNGNVTHTDNISEFMHQPVNLKIDNFVSADCCYDSDKDIDESEPQPEGEISDFPPYIPSFHCNNNPATMSSSASSEKNSGINKSPIPSTPNPMPNNDDPIPLPGEIDSSNCLPNSPHRLHLRATRESIRVDQTPSLSNIITDQGASQSDEDHNNIVQPFELDSNFDYDNVRVTPRLDHYNE